MVAEITEGIGQGQAYDLISLLSKYRQNLEGNGVEAQTYTTQRLKIRLQKHFGDSIVFHQQTDRTKSELIYSSSIKVQDILNAWALANKQEKKGQEESRRYRSRGKIH